MWLVDTGFCKLVVGGGAFLRSESEKSNLVMFDIKTIVPDINVDADGI